MKTKRVLVTKAVAKDIANNGTILKQLLLREVLDNGKTVNITLLNDCALSLDNETMLVTCNIVYKQSKILCIIPFKENGECIINTSAHLYVEIPTESKWQPAIGEKFIGKSPYLRNYCLDMFSYKDEKYYYGIGGAVYDEILQFNESNINLLGQPYVNITKNE